MTATITADSVPVKSDDVLGADTEEFTILMSMDSGNFIELNPSASDIWDLIDGQRSVAGIAERLGEIYAVSPDRCLEEVTALFRRMRDEGLVIFAA